MKLIKSKKTFYISKTMYEYILSLITLSKDNFMAKKAVKKTTKKATKKVAKK